MTTKNYFAWSVALSLAGTLFAGYLSYTKAVSKSCAFAEPCPYFLGTPACYIGAALFLMLLALALLGRAGKMGAREAAKSMCAVAAIGTAFAAYFVAQEVASWFAAGRVLFYGLGLSTCAYALSFFIALLILSAAFLKKKS